MHVSYKQATVPKNPSLLTSPIDFVVSGDIIVRFPCAPSEQVGRFYWCVDRLIAYSGFDIQPELSESRFTYCIFLQLYILKSGASILRLEILTRAYHPCLLYLFRAFFYTLHHISHNGTCKIKVFYLFVCLCMKEEKSNLQTGP